MTSYERFVFDGKCPYNDIPCDKECACVNCEVNTHEIEDAEELDKAESEEWENYADDLIPIIDDAESEDEE